MSHKRVIVFVVAVVMLAAGCSIKEGAKKVLGSSTKTLEEARVEGISKTFYCTYRDCFHAVMELGRQKPSVKPWEKFEGEDKGVLDIFVSDLYANPPYIVVMGVEGSINTTQVGVFFQRVTREAIRVDITSLSSTAKRSAADTIFNHLEDRFKTIE